MNNFACPDNSNIDKIIEKFYLKRFIQFAAQLRYFGELENSSSSRGFLSLNFPQSSQ